MTTNQRLDNMPQFELTAEQQALKERARELAREVIEPRAAEVDRTEQYPWDNVKALREAGFMGMTIPPAYGGQGRSFLDVALVIDEMAQVCGVTGRITVEANMGAISALMQYGTETQKRLGAGLVLAGDKPAICITEPGAGSAASEMTTRADKRGDGYVVNGKKHWITGGSVSRLHLVFARVFDEDGVEQGIGGFIAVRDETPGLTDWPARAGDGPARHPGDGNPVRGHGGPGGPRPHAPARLRARVRGPDECLQLAAGRRRRGRARHRRRRLPARPRLCRRARAVRAPDRRVPGAAMDAGGHERLRLPQPGS